MSSGADEETKPLASTWIINRNGRWQYIEKETEYIEAITDPSISTECHPGKQWRGLLEEEMYMKTRQDEVKRGEKRKEIPGQREGRRI